MKIGIIGAMKSEVEALKAALDTTRRKSKASMEFCEGRLGAVEAVVVQCGIGKVNAGICAQILVDDFLRAISDKADGSAHVSFEEFQKEAAKNSARLVQHMLENW